MSVIDRIKSIANKLNIAVTGETIVDLLDSLEIGVDARIDKSKWTKKEEKTVMSELRETLTPKQKNNKRFRKNDDDE
jgi:hypothetical protein